jgi:hypothetical protein
MRHLTLLILIFTFWTEGKSLDCISQYGHYFPDSAVSVGLRNADIVFYGELINFDTNNLKYSFRIIELFKGEYKKDTIWGVGSKNSLWLSPNVKGLWIIYANELKRYANPNYSEYNKRKMSKEPSICIDICSPSVSLSRAEGTAPLWPINENDINSLKQQVIRFEKRSEGISNWFLYLERLRQYKKSNMVERKGYETKDIFIGLLLFFNVILIILTIWRRKK